MHKTMNINIDNLSKIEGHANLEIKIKDKKVEHVKLEVMENKRFFTQAVRGKRFDSVPEIVSRICGACSVSHLLCCTEAIEKALGVEPSNQTMTLRKLAMYGTMIRDHAMHLYLFVLPDLYNKPTLLDFAGEYKNLIGECFEIKGAGNALTTWTLGRVVHPAFSKIGGLSVLPTKNPKETIHKLHHAREHVWDLIETFHDCNWSFKRDTNFVSLITGDFSHIEGFIRSSDGMHISEKDYWEHLHNVIIPYSQATSFKVDGKECMVGALARMNLNRESMHKETRAETKDFLRAFPTNNIYANNLAQAIEILHCIDHSIELLETTDIKKETLPKIAPKTCSGAGAIEAPRGTLYYGVDIANDGKIKNMHMVIPTAQNLIKMENDIRRLVEKHVNDSKEKITKECEKLIRAYDPCMSCASHFLKVKWV